MVPGAIAAIGAQVADALAAVHGAGVVHGDVKPDNVVVLYEQGIAGWPRIKVIDYGDLEVPRQARRSTGTA